MLRHPELVAGTRERLDTALMKTAPGSRRMRRIPPSAALSFVISSLNAACTTGASRFSRLRMSPPLLRMNWRGSAMRHLTSQSITSRFFSAVKIGLDSGLSSVWIRLSRNTTFWNGGGSLLFKPGSVITSLISPSA